MIEIKMPRLSDTMEEGAVSTWRKHPGDTVAIGDILVEIETDKAVMEYEAYQAGTLAKILVPEGENAEIGAPIALLDDGSGSVGAANTVEQSSERRPLTQGTPATEQPSTGQASTGQASTGQPGTGLPAATNGSANGTVSGTASGAENGAGSAAAGLARQLASPLVRKLAREHHLDLSHITGTGPGGRIIRADISGLLTNGAPAPAAFPAPAVSVPASPVPAGPATASYVSASSVSAAPVLAAQPSGVTAQATAVPEADEARATRSVPISQVRRVIARRLSASAREIPHFYVTAVADAQPLMDLRGTLNEQLTAAGRPKVSVNDLLIRACALALRANPQVNVSYGGDGSSVMLVHDRVNIGVAVAAESGLIVPVITDADTKTVTQLGAEAKNLITLAGERKLTPAQTAGGTFTISNLGMFGVEHFTAIINPPESAILAVGATTREPAVVGDAVVPRYRLRYTLSVDHRVIDGALAAKFLQSLTTLIESPWMIIA